MSVYPDLPVTSVLQAQRSAAIERVILTATLPQGERGEPGPQGEVGSFWLTGEGAPDAESGRISDLYLDRTTGDFYSKSTGTWVTAGTLIGPEGPAGSVGPAGPAAALTIADTITSDPGADAEVTISGTAPAQSLTFTIPRGAAGPTGQGVPVGGATGQALVKASNADHDATWATIDATSRVAKAGDTMSGDLSVAKDTPMIALNNTADAAKIRAFHLQQNGTSRWRFGATADVEIGDNAGSNLEIVRYDDTGAAIDAPLSMSRASGVLNILKGIVVGTGSKVANLNDPTDAKDAATKSYVDTRSVPAGGTTGQVLAKSSATDYATTWTTPAAGGGEVAADPAFTFFMSGA